MLQDISSAPTDGTHIQGFDRHQLALGEVYHGYKPGQGVALPWLRLDDGQPVRPAYWSPSKAGR